MMTMVLYIISFTILGALSYFYLTKPKRTPSPFSPTSSTSSVSSKEEQEETQGDTDTDDNTYRIITDDAPTLSYPPHTIRTSSDIDDSLLSPHYNKDNNNNNNKDDDISPSPSPASSLYGESTLLQSLTPPPPPPRPSSFSLSSFQNRSPSSSISSTSSGNNSSNNSSNTNDKNKNSSNNSSDAEKDRKNAYQLHQLKSEFIHSEYTYVSKLQILYSEFYLPLLLKIEQKGGTSKLTKEQFHHIFSNFDSILKFHVEVFYPELSHGGIDNIILICEKYLDFLKMYSHYVSSYEQCIKTVEYLKQHNSQFNKFLNSEKRIKKCDHLDIMSYLVMIIQRIPRYELFFRGFKEYTHPINEKDKYQQIIHIYNKVKTINNHINETTRNLSLSHVLLDYQHRIVGM